MAITVTSAVTLGYYVYTNPTGRLDTISFQYAEQQAFPPSAYLDFDCEGIFWRQDTLHMFTKNRGPHKGTSYYYKLPAQPGHHVLYRQDSLKTSSLITGADISPNGRHVALQGYGKVFLFDVDANGQFLTHPRWCLKIPRGGQTEAVTFINNTDLLISNEAGILFKAELTQPFQENDEY